MSLDLHAIDWIRATKILESKGWSIDKRFNQWVRPNGVSGATATDQWFNAIIESIVCPHEQRKGEQEHGQRKDQQGP